MKNRFKKGAIQILAILVIVFVIIDILIIGGGSAALGGSAGAFSREGTPSETGVISEETLGPIPPSCNGIVEQAVRYIGIDYWSIGDAENHCGPSTTGAEGVEAVDCSGYVSRVYRDVGLFDQNTCLSTYGLAYNSNLGRIAKDVSTAQIVAEPGDIILFGLGDPDGPPQHTYGTSHVVIYAGNNQSYESGGRGGGGGPHFTSSNVWSGRQLYGVYRAKFCGSE